MLAEQSISGGQKPPRNVSKDSNSGVASQISALSVQQSPKDSHNSSHQQVPTNAGPSQASWHEPTLSALPIGPRSGPSGAVSESAQPVERRRRRSVGRRVDLMRVLLGNLGVANKRVLMMGQLGRLTKASKALRRLKKSRRSHVPIATDVGTLSSMAMQQRRTS